MAWLQEKSGMAGMTWSSISRFHSAASTQIASRYSVLLGSS